MAGRRVKSKRKLLAGKIPHVAVIIPVTGAYAQELLHGVASYSRLHGPWSFVVDPVSLADPVALLRGWRGDGIIAFMFNDELADAIKRIGVPAVDLRSAWPVKPGPMPRVMPDNVAVGRLAVEHLLDRGFRNIAYCGYTGRLGGRVQGFRRAIAEAGVDVLQYEDQGYLKSDWGWELQDPLQRSLDAWVARLPKPVGIVAADDSRARQVAQSCERVGLRIPGEVAVVGVNNDALLCEFSNPSLSSVDPDARAVGFAGAALLDQLMKQHRGRTRTTRLHEPVVVPPAGVVTRGSTDALAVANADVAAAMRFITDHATQRITVKHVLEAVPLARRTLERLFRQHLGRSPREEILRVQLERARRLLIETDLPVPIVAQSAGFRDGKHLHALFSAAEGTGPAAFRKHSRRHG